MLIRFKWVTPVLSSLLRIHILKKVERAEVEYNIHNYVLVCA